MSIDARVETVHINEDGSGHLALIDRPKRFQGDYDGIAGQSALYFEVAPEEVTALNGLDVWGPSSCILLGDVAIAERIGYGRIKFADRATFTRAVTEYHRKRRAAT